MKKLIIAGALLMSPLLSQAAVYPERTIFDKRIQYVTYNSEDVVVIKTKLGNATIIQLEEGEHLNSDESALAIGDKAAWSIAVRENNIIIKPIDDFPETNINVVSNKRTYAFDLVEAKSASDVSFFVRFKYPKIVDQSELEKNTKNPEFPLCSDGARNFEYFKYGDDDLAPTRVWDDGKFTCFKYPNNKPLPAIYKYMPDTDLKEALVNFNVKDDTIIVQTTAEEFRLRLGDKVLGIKTDNLNNIPFNRNKTATGQQREVIKNEQQ